jgi:hypothetical protein
VIPLRQKGKEEFKNIETFQHLMPSREKDFEKSRDSESHRFPLSLVIGFEDSTTETH